MKNCPYCGQQNPESNQFCNKCGADMMNVPKPEPDNINLPVYNNQSVLENGSVKFVLYLHCIFVPIVGLILGLLVSITPFQGQKELSSKLIACACIAGIVWFMISFAIGFIVAFAMSL